MLASISMLLRVRLMRDRGDLSGARKLVAKQSTQVPWLRIELESEAAYLRLEQPVRQRDRQLVDAAVAAGANGHLLSANGNLRAFGEVSSHVELRDLKVQPIASQIERLLQRANRQLSRGCNDVGRSYVVQALMLGEEELLRRPFRHAGPLVYALIRADREVARQAAWLTRFDGSSDQPVLRAARDSGSDQVDDGAVAPVLTDREQEILEHLAGLLSTQEIAASMFISVNTVRTHVRHILDKFSVSRRSDAVRRARVLGLV
jgi:LuxR family maltose regulon positive regulatory protein